MSNDLFVRYFVVSAQVNDLVVVTHMVNGKIPMCRWFLSICVWINERSEAHRSSHGKANQTTELVAVYRKLQALLKQPHRVYPARKQ